MARGLRPCSSRLFLGAWHVSCGATCQVTQLSIKDGLSYLAQLGRRKEQLGKTGTLSPKSHNLAAVPMPDKCVLLGGWNHSSTGVGNAKGSPGLSCVVGCPRDHPGAPGWSGGPGLPPSHFSLLGPSTSGWLFLRFILPSTPLVP